jgi:hypothetical protein
MWGEDDMASWVPVKPGRSFSVTAPEPSFPQGLRMLRSRPPGPQPWIWIGAPSGRI